MLEELKKIPADFPESSRVWIFQSNRPFRAKEVVEINEQLKNFYVQWQSHGAEVKGWSEVLFNHFIVVMADEASAGVSGCSTDGMTRIIKSIEKQYLVELFDRLTLTFLVKDKVQMLPINQVPYALEKGYIETDTLLFNNLAQNKEELLSNWLQPLDKSWLWPRIVQKQA